MSEPRTCNICRGPVEGGSIPHGGGWGVAHARAEDCVAYRNKVLGDALLARSCQDGKLIESLRDQLDAERNKLARLTAAKEAWSKSADTGMTIASEIERRQRRHFSAALTWIEQNLPGDEGVKLVAKALAATNGDPRWFEREGRFHVTTQWPNKKSEFLCTKRATTFDEARAEACAAFEGQWFFRIEDTETGGVQIDEGFDPTFRET